MHFYCLCVAVFIPILSHTMSSLGQIKPSRFAEILKRNELTLAHTKHQLEETVTKKQRKNRQNRINELRFNQKKQKPSIVLLDGCGFKYPIHPNIYPYPYPNTKTLDLKLLIKRQKLFLQTLDCLNKVNITILQRALKHLPRKKAEIDVALQSSLNIQIATLNTLIFFDSKAQERPKKYLSEGDFLEVYAHQFELAQKLEREVTAFEEAQKEQQKILTLAELTQQAASSK
ncbi:MAG: hypothetical protein WD055_02050 [Candidatus Dependentiae bacterium]